MKHLNARARNAARAVRKLVDEHGAPNRFALSEITIDPPQLGRALRNRTADFQRACKEYGITAHYDTKLRLIEVTGASPAG